MVEIRWTDEAVAWLEDIFAYITEDNIAVARRVVSEIYELVKIL